MSHQLNVLKELYRPYYLRWFYFRFFPARRPEYFSACWRHPFQRFGDGLSCDPPRTGLPDLLFYPMVDWHTRMQRTQHLVRAFAGMGYRCIYLNPHLGRQFDSLRVTDPAHRLAQLEANVWELHVRLPREPVLHHRLLRPDEEGIIQAAVERTLDAMESHGAVQVVSFPGWGGVARAVRKARRAPVVYDCHDWLAGFDAVRREIVRAEAGLMRASDLVLFSSESLRERHGCEGRFALVRNAVDASHFQRAQAARGPALAGYVGALDGWFDVAAVAAAARANPGCRFVLVGRVEDRRVRQLEGLPNVEFTGEICYERLPELLARFRIGLIPFLMNDLTRAADPIKLYEYFSRGLPVVSAPLPEVLRMGDLAYFASGAEAFAREVGRALAEDDPERRQRRMQIAEQESWEERARSLGAELRRLV